MAEKRLLTSGEVRQLLTYVPQSGIFYWAVGRPGASRGKRAGRVSRAGYREIGICNQFHRENRLAFLLMTGKWPDIDVDHINGVKHDNRWNNLRLATRSQNMANVRARRNNSSGHPGVVWDKDRSLWRAQIRLGGVKKNLGRFSSKEDAVNAVNLAARTQWGEFASWAKN